MTSKNILYIHFTSLEVLLNVNMFVNFVTILKNSTQQTNLFHHIQNAHILVNDKEIQSTAITNVVDTLEEGKLRFLQLILNFNSQFNLL